MKTTLTVIGGILAALAIASIALFGWSLLIAFPVKWLWNYVMPTIFNLQMISYWQSFCILLLSGLLLKPTSASKTNDK